MPYKQPLRKKGKREPLHYYILRMCWYETKFEDVLDEITRKEFIEDFHKNPKSKALIKKIESQYNVEFNYYDSKGNIRQFNYESMRKNSIFSKYEWEEQYPPFKVDKIAFTKNTARERIERRTDLDTITDIKQLDDIDELIDETEDPTDLKRLQATKSMIVERMNVRVGLDETNIKINVDDELENIRRITDVFS